MYFHSIQKKVNLAAHDPVKLNNVPLTVATSYKYLGVILDSQLTYKLHIDKLTKQLKQILYVFQQIRPYLTVTLATCI